jgi:hypothetical protein
MAGELAKSSLVIVKNRIWPMMLTNTCQNILNKRHFDSMFVHFKDITSRKFGPLTSISLLEHSLVPQRLTASNRSVSLMTRSSSFTNINSVDSVMSSKGAWDRESFVRHRIRFRLLSCQVQHFFPNYNFIVSEALFNRMLPLVKSLQTSLQIQGPCTHYRG